MFLVFIAIFIVINTGQGLAKFEQAKKTITFIWKATFTDCKGKDAGNYTNTVAFGSNALCSQDSMSQIGGGWVAHSEKGNNFISTSRLAFARYPAGGESSVFILIKL